MQRHREGLSFITNFVLQRKVSLFLGLLEKRLRKETERQVNSESFDIFTVVWLRISFVWDMTLHPFVSGSR